MFMTINKIDAQGTVIKYDGPFDTEVEAQTRIAELHAMKLIDAFYIDVDATSVNGERCFQNPPHWTADPTAKTVTFNQVSFDAEVREKHMKILRGERDNLLVKSDNHVNPDQWASMNDVVQNKWSDYRQALRDLPANTADPTDITWPVEPA
jgi:hypothetical protein